MKTRALLSVLAIAFLFIGKAYGGNNTWLGGTSIYWSNPANWSGGVPSNGDKLLIGGGTTYAPTLDIASTFNRLTITSSVTITLSAAATANTLLAFTAGNLTLAGTGSISFGSTGTIPNSSQLIIGSGNTVTFTGVLTVNAGGSLTNNGALNINSGLTLGGNPAPVVNTGTITLTAAALSVAAGGSIANTGTITTTSGSTVGLNGNPAPINNNLNGTFNATSTTFTMAAGSSITNTGGTFNMTSCTVTCNGNSTSITNVNSGATTANFTMTGTAVTFNLVNSITNTSGSFTINGGSSITMATTTNNSSISNAGTFTINGGSSVTMSSTTNANKLTNTGTFYAGTTGSACTLNLSSAFATLTNSAAGTFYLGSTSVINPTVSGATMTNSGTFTIQSDVNGCGAIGQITSGASISGTYNVERYITGVRGYRLMSSPVYTSTSGANVYSLSYLASNLYLTGSGAGFSHSGNPTIYLYDESFTPQYSTFLNSNYIGVATLPSGTSPAYGVNVNGAGLSSTYTLPVGTGFNCFFRGNPASQTTAVLTTPAPKGTFPTEVAATVTNTGTLVTGQVTFKEWYNGSSTLGSTNQLFNLIGNPYPCAIDLNTIGTTAGTGITVASVGGANGITSHVYQLIPSGTYAGQYGIWTVGGTSLTATNGASEYVASGEAFFVVANGTTQLVFNESAKATSTNATAFGIMARRTDFAALNTAQPANPVLRLKLAMDTTSAEETLIEFNPSASAKYVFSEDAPHRAGSGAVHFASRSSDSVAMTINSMPLQKSQSIPLNVYVTNDGQYTINMAQAVSLPALYDVWLMDAYKKDSLDIKHNPTYTFDVKNADASSYGTERFSLVVRQNAALMVHLLSFGASKVEMGDQVAWTTENEANYTNFAVERSTDGGNTFTQIDAVVSSTQGSYNYLDKTPANGANQYRLKITDLNGTVTYSSVVTIMYGNVANHIALNALMLYPNPTVGPLNLSITNAQSLAGANTNVKPSYSIEIVNNFGSVIKSSQSGSSQWQSDVSTLTPGTYFIRVVDANTSTVVGKSAFVKL